MNRMRRKAHKKQRTLADVLADNYISKRELMDDIRQSFIEHYSAKKEGWKLKSAEKLLNEL